MLKKEDKQINFFDEYVYGYLIPLDHILVKIGRYVDFFVEAEMKDLYSLDQGRPAYPAGLLFRMFFLEFYYNLSDVKVMK